MATITTNQLLYELRQICHKSRLVNYLEERLIDADVLSIRVHLNVANSFISVFYNVTTEKTAFALVEHDQRIYGADNAKIGWHKHPFGHPRTHLPCEPITFANFLVDVEAYYQA